MARQRDRSPAAIPLQDSRRSLFWLWVAGFLVLVPSTILVAFLRSDLQGHVADVVGAVLPNVFPTLMLMVGVFAVGAINPTPDTTRVSLFFHRIVYWGSVTYFGFVALPFLIEPLTSYDLFEVIKITNVWLPVVQGLVTLAMGTLFAKPK
jgi:hypothetical protein